jgi:adenosylmethionine-8-amino-7-oxononanoate aminotransferase
MPARAARSFRRPEGPAEKHELIGDVRGGHGLMCALELVSDRPPRRRSTRRPSARIFEATYEAGVMVRVSGPNIILSPPLILHSAAELT